MFLFLRATVSLSYGSLFYAYEAEQSSVTVMWCVDEDAFKPGAGMYVGGNGR